MQNHHTSRRTAEEWEARLGTNLRTLRLRLNLTQAEVARRAGIDRTTVARLERGDGGSVRSLVGIARALGRDDWLDSFAPPEPTINPMDLLVERDRARPPNRSRTRRSPTPQA